MSLQVMAAVNECLLFLRDLAPINSFGIVAS
jgi:hypothetical protein